MSNLIITALYIYPIKSLAGIEVAKAKVESHGFQNDRRFMLVDENNQFITQRKFAKMALLQPELTATEIIVRHKTEAVIPLKISLNEPNTTSEMVTIWDDTCPAKPVSPEADEWFSAVLGMKCRLMYMHDDSIRQADQRYAINETDKVSFADGYPYLMISEESLAQLNGKLDEPMDMRRFRPSIVFKGGKPHEEDEIRRVFCNGIEMYGVKPCARCVMTTVNPDTSEKGKEPLKTLSTYRQTGNKILFGENFIATSKGELKVGYLLKVLERKIPSLR
ncbi:MOSC N-terminal beta barrel domain-containing protein [uncultured Roseivirga sp.]|mgnify:CR=1 FL=1|uniref:MOSC domain-containing protein n=1 Tax=uncultured Roseivirga sp. TaxID=543088 RepID=UPI0030D931A6|tara:strand:- start:154691 stop:155521 length:831 start_codon:yes stop_codon:yes gene_type:complete